WFLWSLMGGKLCLSLLTPGDTGVRVSTPDYACPTPYPCFLVTLIAGQIHPGPIRDSGGDFSVFLFSCLCRQGKNKNTSSKIKPNSTFLFQNKKQEGKGILVVFPPLWRIMFSPGRTRNSSITTRDVLHSFSCSEGLGKWALVHRSAGHPLRLFLF